MLHSGLKQQHLGPCIAARPSVCALHQQQHLTSRVVSSLLARRANRLAAAGSKTAELSPKDQALLKQMMNYQHTVELQEGRQLVISPLRVEWLQRTGDLLADTFVDAKGIQPYRRYVRRNIGKYLDQHINMPPSAVLLVAILRTPVEGGDDPDLHPLHQYGSPSPSSSSPSSNSSSDSSSGSNNNSSSSNSSGSGTLGAGAASSNVEVQATHPLNRLLLRWLGWLVTPNEPQQKQQQQQQDEAAAGGEDAGSNSGSSSSSSSSIDGDASSSSRGGGGGLVGSMVQSALQQLGSSMGLQPQGRAGQRAQQQTRMVEELLGVAEVSFEERTRSQALTLNPPQRCAYLCNMAVTEPWRRRGVARALLAAIEDMCLLAGEADLYLHLRFKDSVSAGALYRGSGFQEAKRDCWLLLLAGQEPRFLMRKQLDPLRRLVGRVMLPGYAQQQGPEGDEVAAQQQQQQQQQRLGGAPQAEPVGDSSGPAAPAPAASPAA